jgi:undecaprenyl-phosphate glucose phosphotransferase
MPRSLLKPHATLLVGLLRLCDPALAVLVGIVAYRLYLGEWLPPDRYLLFLAVGVLAVVAVFPLFGLYEPQRGVSFAGELQRLVAAWLLLAAVAGIAIFASKTGDAFSRVWVTAWIIAGLAATGAVRTSIRLILRALRRRGFNLRHVAIVGAGDLGRTVAETLQASAWAGYNVVGFYDDDAAKRGTTVAGRPVLVPADAVVRDVAAGCVDQVWIALPLRAEPRIRDVLTALHAHPVEVRFVPDIYDFHLLNHSISDVAGLPVVSLTETPMSGRNRVVKAIEDYVLAAAFLVAAAPLMILIGLGVKLSSPGPVLYRQDRVTWNGDRFPMLKFRTMPLVAEAGSGPVWARSGDGRATRFGAFLRRYSLDELPQFINVLRGEMSIVGPRPERPEFVERFSREIPGYMQKHLVKAGITGWAQVNDLRGDTDLRERIRHDLYYIENWSPWFDLRIIALTIGHVFRSRHAY